MKGWSMQLSGKEYHMTFAQEESRKTEEKRKPPKYLKEPPALIQDGGYCGGTHLRMKCSPYGKKCANCGKLHHFAKINFTKKVNVKNEQRFDRPTVIFKFKRRSFLTLTFLVKSV